MTMRYPKAYQSTRPPEWFRVSKRTFETGNAATRANRHRFAVSDEKQCCAAGRRSDRNSLLEQSGPERARHDPSGGRYRSCLAEKNDITTAGEGGRSSLVENHFAYAEQRRHHADTQSKAARQNERANRMREQ